MAKIIETVDRLGTRREHSVSSDLSDKDAMERLGILNKPFTVTIWEEGAPHEARRVQTLHIDPTGNRISITL